MFAACGDAPLAAQRAREAAMLATGMGTTSDLRPLDHLISADQFDRDRVDALLARAAELDGVRDQRYASRIMATLFYEPSTRTRLSFESAMLRRGGSVIGTEAAAAFSSAAKGETLEDTIRIVTGYADVIVLRHPEAGAAQRAAAVAGVPVINAGDGPGEHPTQALLDLFCIRRELGRLDSLHVVLCGDLRNGRTVHSLVRLLSRYPGMRLSFVAPDDVQIDAATLASATAQGVHCERVGRLDEVVATADVLYQTRVQKERFSDLRSYEAARRIRVDAAVMRSLPEHAILMHPLPRIDEIAPEVDADPRSAYFRQATGGVAVRMAVLEMMLGAASR